MEARRNEGVESDDERGPVEAFERWYGVFEKCVRLEEVSDLNPHVD